MYMEYILLLLSESGQCDDIVYKNYDKTSISFLDVLLNDKPEK